MEPTTTTKPSWLDAEANFDADALQEKYREERDKRLRGDGLNQYKSVDESALKHYAEDIWAKRVQRDPIEETIDYLIVGAGFSGMLLAVRLIEAGITNLKIIDKAGDFGGTWYWNQYPGAACDIEAYIYMPLLDETGYVPTEKYARGPELYDHSQRIARLYNLYDKALLQTEVESLTWDEKKKRWEVSTNRGDQLQARFVTTAGGLLHKMKFPGVPGIESFKGHSFHTSRWDYTYTKGNQQGNLTGLADKRVAIIGTGATSLQAVPHLGRWSKQLYVFQRTPSSVDVRLDQPTDPEWAKTLNKGWQQRRMDNFNILVSGGHQNEDLVNDGWTDILSNISISGKMVEENKKAANPIEAAKQLQKRMQLADFKKMEQVRKRIDSIVKDPTTADSLKPWYNFMCKRPGFHNDYLPTFNRPNVTLVDTKGKGIERITEKGVVFAGKEYEVDCIVYATGFEYIGNDYSERMRINMEGRNGIALHEHWKDGPRTFHGLYTRGFPNHFIMSVTQSAVAPNFTHMLNEQAKHIAYVVSEAARRGITTVETSAEAEQQWIDNIIELGKLREGFLKECTPSYYNDEGKISRKTLQNGRYGLGSPAFIKLLEDWRATGKLEGLEFDGRPVSEALTFSACIINASEKVPISQHVQGFDNLVPIA